ncbi:AAA family ATPase [Laspinema sp. A4]|uniref:hybrid sensor histidine kinase/response regulator n=1 Tax=Laspinema sp. D2d TaxID=2953686 RepID=UPI0021BB7211|nr:AAA family ATPase [Laspinema sp. D2d]MCT7983852.1 AAA family ATPase [Laspinema sp. D2d]
MAVNLNNYQFLETLHSGGKTVIYRVQNQVDGSKAIVKTLKSEYPTLAEITRLRHEYQILENLHVNAVIQPLGLEPYKNGWALFLEDTESISLSEWLGSHFLSIIKFLEIAIPLVTALSELHNQHIIHKDIKPQNIIINPLTETVQLIDFGIASRLERESPTLSHPDLLEGTLAYMSPEQTGRMNRTLDYRSDFYSLGVTFYELLTGTLPFSSNDPLELVHSHIAKTPIPPHKVNAEIPEAISTLIMKLLAKTAEDRYQSAAGLKFDLETCLIQLQTTGEITQFIPGHADQAGQLTIPQKLYGREVEIATLLNTFERVANGTTEMMLVSGYSGIGKTVLVAEVHKPIVRQRGYFISGKFDQFKRNIPFASLIQAFQSLILQLLTERDAQIEIWKEKLLNALGRNGQVIIDVIPEVELIIGKQLPVPELAATEAQNRFSRVFKQFISVFTTKEHPLVLFLDDLQWADSASLKLIELLMTDTDSQYFLLIGAYRDNEVNPVHPTIQTIERIEQAGTVIHNIVLDPLHLHHVEQLVSETLNETVRSQPLAELLFNKTAGNPFFLTQLILSLYQENLLVYHLSQGTWHWNIAQIQAIGITDYTVVELMARNIRKLPPNTQEIVKLAACIGNTFNLEVLGIVKEQSNALTAAELWLALQAGLILPLSNDYKIPLAFSSEVSSGISLTDVRVDYKFLHDRVQQAAYSLIPEDQKKQTHLKIGQLLLQSTTEEERKENIFALVNQLNYGTDLLTSDSEKYQLAALNLMAGQKAKAATAYESALKYLNVGLELLGERAWKTDYSLILSLYNEAAEAVYLTGDFPQMQGLIEVVLHQALSLLDKLKVYEIQMQAYLAQGQVLESLKLGLSVLKELGIDLPNEPNLSDVQQAFSHTASVLGNQENEELLNLPLMSDPHQLATISILSHIWSSAYIGFPLMGPLLVCKQVDLSVEHGNAPISSFAYALYAFFLCGFGEIERGYQLGQMALRLASQLNLKNIETKVHGIIYAGVIPWKEPLINTLEPLRSNYFSGVETGEIEYGTYSIFEYSYYSFFAGKPLISLEREVAKITEAMKNAHQENSLQYQKIVWQVILNLIEKAENPARLKGRIYDKEMMMAPEIKINNQLEQHYFLTYKIMLCCVFEHYLEGLQAIEILKDSLSAAPGQVTVTIYYFYESIIRLALYEKGSEAEKTLILERVQENQAKLQKWATHAPMNFLHKFYLVEAERYRVVGDKLEAIEMYDRAIALAKENHYIQDAALAYELSGKFYQAWGKQTIAKAYMTEAYYGYIRWGANAKVKDLEQRYPELLASVLNPANPIQTIPTTTSITHETITSSSAIDTSILDMASVIKASQVISGEIVLPHLLDKLMKILIENAGAERGTLILFHEGKWLIEGTGTKEDVQVLQSLPVEDSINLAIAAIKYVIQTQKDVILNDASTEDFLSNDPYLQMHRTKSLLCLPIRSQGQLKAILYLENNLISGAFTTRRVEVLKMLSSQAAIALENATLYHTLELKVETRTQELKTKNDRLKIEIQERQRAEQAADMANRAKSQFLASMSHELRTPLNGILGYTQILNRDIYLNQTQKSGIKIIHQCGEHLLTLINDVLDLSKIEAGKMELQPQEFHFLEFLQSISDICRVRAESKGITLIYEPSPYLPKGVFGDEKRLRQVLINLLGNAVKFTESGSVTFQVESLPPAKLDPQRPQMLLRFRVQDTGIGITPEQLSTIFLPFEQVNGTVRQTEGTGLGLAISRQLVEMMGSTIQVESEAGKGSQFWFELELPVLEHYQEELKQHLKIIRGYVGEPRKILVVDDRWENRSVLVNLLATIGFEVQEANDGQECLNQVQSFQPDCIIIDLVMPVMDGFEAMRRIRKMPEFKKVVAIGTSTSILSSGDQFSEEIGCDDFLLKPIREEQLLDCLGQHLGLEWIYDEPAAVSVQSSDTDAPTSSSGEAIAPNTEELTILFDLAMKGELVTIQQRVQQLADGDPRYAAFATQMIHLAKTFAEEELLALVQSYLEAGE